MSHKKTVVAQTKAELVRICDQFNIQVDNPIVILTQQTAKTFLTNSTEKSFYKVRPGLWGGQEYAALVAAHHASLSFSFRPPHQFFRLGTQLETIDRQVYETVERQKAMVENVAVHKRQMSNMEKEFEAAKKKFQVQHVDSASSSCTLALARLLSALSILCSYPAH
jgi:hypothetical protein